MIRFEGWDFAWICFEWNSISVKSFFRGFWWHHFGVIFSNEDGKTYDELHSDEFSCDPFIPYYSATAKRSLRDSGWKAKWKDVVPWPMGWTCHGICSPGIMELVISLDIFPQKQCKASQIFRILHLVVSWQDGRKQYIGQLGASTWGLLIVFWAECLWAQRSSKTSWLVQLNLPRCISWSVPLAKGFVPPSRMEWVPWSMPMARVQAQTKL